MFSSQNLLDMIDCQGQTSICSSQRTCRNIDPSTIKTRKCNFETLSFGAQQILLWDTTILKNDRSCWLRVPSHFLFLFAKGESRSVLLDHNCRNAAAGGIASSRHDDIDVGLSSAANKCLFSVENVVISDESRRGAERGGVGASAGLGETVGGEFVHGAERRHPSRALLRGGKGVNHPGDHVVNGEIGSGRGAAGSESLEHHRSGQTRKARAAKLLARVGTSKAETGKLLQLCTRENLMLIPLGSLGK